ncbi:phosphopentomutase [Yersinia aleksiciae]|uniref:phosphopentomutase n=1 Tax=Yersinia aleksiciae TaxID=263819 RepID=UPI001427E509|nr:phosphopentomutase [Yersinia aleksiciae]MDA5497710.1 phosphopentomutase [Yersinia aleksiciae]NIK98147.1 phosphopentomutase [Yersinia aleksiciae]WQC69844.1 phosphopentomutase [Yersinia aleksiciae]
MSKFIVLVIDSFGVGAMPDVAEVRPQDITANTCAHILQTYPGMRLPQLEKMGLLNALHIGSPDFKESVMQESAQASFGVALLQHEGGDTFMGHQEIMGTLPRSPLSMPFSSVKSRVADALRQQGYQVEQRGAPEDNSDLQFLWVNDAVAIGDNLEADLGQVFNICANLSVVDFELVEKIGRIVRSCVAVNRVIAYGGQLTDSHKIVSAAEVKQQQYIGINSPKSGVYDNGFQVIHLGYGVDAEVQAPYQLKKVRIPTILVGKVADIVANPTGRNYQQLVDSQTILDITLAEVQRTGSAFICTNIQETDLAGHGQDVERYAERLQLADNMLGKITAAMVTGDCLVVMADHGNDPTIGHSKHTREQVPLLVYHAGVTNTQQQAIRLGIRETMSDVGATVCEFFAAPAPQNGHSFWQQLMSASQ